MEFNILRPLYGYKKDDIITGDMYSEHLNVTTTNTSVLSKLVGGIANGSLKDLRSIQEIDLKEKGTIYIDEIGECFVLCTKSTTAKVASSACFKPVSIKLTEDSIEKAVASFNDGVLYQLVHWVLPPEMLPDHLIMYDGSTISATDYPEFFNYLHEKGITKENTFTLGSKPEMAIQVKTNAIKLVDQICPLGTVVFNTQSKRDFDPNVYYPGTRWEIISDRYQDAGIKYIEPKQIIKIITLHESIVLVLFNDSSFEFVIPSTFLLSESLPEGATNIISILANKLQSLVNLGQSIKDVIPCCTFNHENTDISNGVTTPYEITMFQIHTDQYKQLFFIDRTTEFKFSVDPEWDYESISNYKVSRTPIVPSTDFFQTNTHMNIFKTIAGTALVWAGVSKNNTLKLVFDKEKLVEDQYNDWNQTFKNAQTWSNLKDIHIAWDPRPALESRLGAEMQKYNPTPFIIGLDNNGELFYDLAGDVPVPELSRLITPSEPKDWFDKCQENIKNSDFYIEGGKFTLNGVNEFKSGFAGMEDGTIKYVCDVPNPFTIRKESDGSVMDLFYETSISKSKIKEAIQTVTDYHSSLTVLYKNTLDVMEIIENSDTIGHAPTESTWIVYVNTLNKIRTICLNDTSLSDIINRKIDENVVSELSSFNIVPEVSNNIFATDPIVNTRFFEMSLHDIVYKTMDGKLRSPFTPASNLLGTDYNGDELIHLDTISGAVNKISYTKGNKYNTKLIYSNGLNQRFIHPKYIDENEHTINMKLVDLVTTKYNPIEKVAITDLDSINPLGQTSSYDYGVVNLKGNYQTVIVEHNLGVVPDGLLVTPIGDTEAKTGEIFYTASENTIRITNTGSSAGQVSWVAMSDIVSKNTVAWRRIG